MGLRKQISLRLIAFMAVLLFIHAVAAQALQGRVVSQNDTPIPGLTVILQNADHGRSAPRYTDSNGKFVFVAVPPSSQPYYLELFWGTRIVHKEDVGILGAQPKTLPPIHLTAK